MYDTKTVSAIQGIAALLGWCPVGFGIAHWTARIGAKVSVGILAHIGNNAGIGIGTCIGPLAYVGADADVRSRAFIGDSAHIGSRAFIGDSAHISARAFIGDSADIGAGATVGVGAHINSRASIKAGAVVGAGVHVEAGAVVGTGAHVGDSAYIGAESRVGTNAHIGAGAYIRARACVATIDFGWKVAIEVEAERDIDPYVRIGCQRYRLSEWLTRGDQIAQQHGVPTGQVMFLRRILPAFCAAQVFALAPNRKKENVCMNNDWDHCDGDQISTVWRGHRCDWKID